MTNLSKHFTLSEATWSETAVAKGIDNQPSSDELAILRLTAFGLEQVRKLLGDKPVIITSWFRSEALNRAVGGVPNSAHRLGYAVDFHRPGMTVKGMCQRIHSGRLAFDQLIYERNPATGNEWCHISFDPRLRQELLTTHDNGKTYKRGIV